uniref:Membrane spanning protein n=1 Tax=Heterorhabditis bacteriophora TaxID=37862 RepID=A0A1I7XC12_HETBA
MLIALFHMGVSSAVFTWVVRSLVVTNKSRFEGGFELVLVSVVLIASLILIVGLRFESRRLISGYIIAQVIVAAISLLFILFLALIMGLKAGILDDPDHNGYNTLEEEMLIVVEIFASLAVVAIEVWFLTIVLKSYRFINNKYHYTGANREDEV